MKIADEEESALFEHAVRNYNFDLEEDNDDESTPSVNQPSLKN